MAGLEDYKQVFMGKQFAVGIKERGPSDHHAVLQILTEDDDSWFLSAEPWSSYWLPDLQEQLRLAQQYLKANCREDKDKWGYEFQYCSLPDCNKPVIRNGRGRHNKIFCTLEHAHLAAVRRGRKKKSASKA